MKKIRELIILGSKTNVYQEEDLQIFVSKDEGLWYLSISHPTRFPTYEEIKHAQYVLLPDEVTMAMLFPPKKEFVNIHNNCFHLWEIKQ